MVSVSNQDVPVLKPDIFRKRLDRVREHIAKDEADLGLFFNPRTIYYLTGFRHIATERPIAILIPADEEPIAFLPRLEVTHWEHDVSWIPEVESYFEYPDTDHPMKILASLLKERTKNQKSIGADAKGAPKYWGYEGPLLTEILKDWKFLEYSSLIPSMRIIKEPIEVELIRISARWGKRAHQILQEEVAPGKTEWDIATKATITASQELLSEMPPPSPSMLPAFAGFRGQIGPNSGLPHATFKNLKVSKGDVLVTGASADIYHYFSELERTMIVGKPSEKQRRYFKAMLDAQDAAIAAIKPEVTCAEIDKASFSSFKENGFSHLVWHHTGHSIGLEAHEQPFLDRGLNTPLRPGMVLTVEPGIYERGFGGFRHSDTVLVTETGVEMLTNYPKDLRDLIIR